MVLCDGSRRQHHRASVVVVTRQCDSAGRSARGAALWPSVIALKAIVSRQQATIVMKTPSHPHRSAIHPTPVPATADPNT